MRTAWKETVMCNAVENYRKMVDEPWGRMFYDQIFGQLIIPEDRRAKILDFGAGFCLTADHYAKHHDVIAVEPNKEIHERRVRDHDYLFVGQGAEYLRSLEDNGMDVVICHNVLEYADNKEEILGQLFRILKPGGIFSIVKHNLCGRVLGAAVLQDDPKAALELLCSGDSENSMFGKRDVYDIDFLTGYFSGRMILTDIFGIRTFFGLSSNSAIKYTDEWYESMLELETRASTVDEFRRVAFFNHLLFQKIEP